MSYIITIVKGSTKIKKETERLFFNKDKNIIALDYKAHKQLKTLNIKHEIFDVYLDKDDKHVIEKLVTDINTNWYKNKNISNALTFRGINFGWLLEAEFHVTLLMIIRTFYCLLKINEKHNPTTVIISRDLLEMANVIFKNCKIQTLEESDDKNQQFNLDFFSIKYNLGPIPITFRIPRKYFFMLRQTYDKLISSKLSKILFTSINEKKLFVLLVDFNPVQYDKFLHELSKKNINILLLNRKRVASWNFESFSIIRKTKSIPVTYEHFLKQQDKQEMHELTTTMTKNLEVLLSNEKLFDDIFSVNLKPFWGYLSKYFKDFCIERFKEAIYEMVGAEKFLSVIKPSIILHFYDVALQEKLLIYYARKNKIPNVMIQHGTPYLSLPGFTALNHLHGTIPIYQDKKVAVWGNVMKDYCLHEGVKENDVIVSGSLRHDEFFQLKNMQNPEKGIIVIALGQLNNMNVDTQTLSTYDKYENSLNIICKVLKKITDRKKIVKLHPGDMVFNTVSVESIIHKIDPTIQIVVSTDLGKLLQSADVVITVGLTTVLLESNILEKPTLTLVADEQDHFSILNNGFTELFADTDEERFEKFLNDMLTNKKLRDNQIQKGINFVNAYMSNQGHASEYLAKKIFE